MSDRVFQLSNDLPVFTEYKNASTAYTPEEDGFLMVDFKPDDSASTIVITTYDLSKSSMCVGNGMSASGARVNYTIPCIKGHQYRTDRSIAKGSLIVRFMPLHG